MIFSLCKTPNNVINCITGNPQKFHNISSPNSTGDTDHNKTYIYSNIFFKHVFTCISTSQIMTNF